MSRQSSFSENRDTVLLKIKLLDGTVRVYPSAHACVHFVCSFCKGHTADMSCLHLLHGDPTAQTWTDITSQVSLYVTHVYAVFHITHFSWWVCRLVVVLLLCVFACVRYGCFHFVCAHRYWLWYTTQKMVSGSVRKIYQKLKQFKVQFLVLQRKSDPSQVILQCLPSNKVCSRSLHFGVKLAITCYLWVLWLHVEKPNSAAVCAGGRQGSVSVGALWRAAALRRVRAAGRGAVLCWLREGLGHQHRSAALLPASDMFCVFLLLTACWCPAERPDCVEGRLRFAFYSSLKNLKEVYICAAKGQVAPVRGQVRISHAATINNNLEYLWLRSILIMPLFL